MNVSYVYSPSPVKPLKRGLIEDFDPELEPPLKKHRPVINWLSNLPLSPPKTTLHRTESAPPLDSSKIPPPFPLLFPRAQSLPPRFDNTRIPATIYDFTEEPKSSKRINEMASERASSSSSKVKIKPSDPTYQSVLKHNGVRMDRTGLDMDSDIRKMVKKEILKNRSTPPLSQEELNDTARTMDRWANTTESVVGGLMNSPLFPIQQRSLGVGGNSQWPVDALPYNQTYGIPLSPPRPDVHVGYPRGLDAPWSDKQGRVVDHPFAKPYTQPATGSSLPFLTVELKSEATGGTLWHAENQAAGSGTYCVKAMQWLMQHGDSSEDPSMLDTVSFSCAANARQVVFYVHYYSPEVRAYCMSWVQSCTITNPEDIQRCRDLVKNIRDYGLGVRLKTLQKALENVYPQTDQWTKKRSSSAADLEEPSTPATSFATTVSVKKSNRR